MRLLSSSCGNDSVAMLIKAQLDGLEDLTVVYCHTGWAAASWAARIQRVRDYCELVAGVPFVELNAPRDFATLMRDRKGFPMPGKTWCSFWLKALPFLEYADEVDLACEAIVMIGKRRDESPARRDTPEWIESSEQHGGRRVHHPLAFVTEAQRNRLLTDHGFEVLPTRSQECAPCVNANRTDMRALTETEIQRTIDLEGEVGQNMFRPHHHMGASGFKQVIQWARAPRGKYEPPEPPGATCTEGYCE